MLDRMFYWITNHFLNKNFSKLIHFLNTSIIYLLLCFQFPLIDRKFTHSKMHKT